MGIAWGGLVVAGCFFDPQGAVVTSETGGGAATGEVATSRDSTGGSDPAPTTGGPTGDTDGGTSGGASGDPGDTGDTGDTGNIPSACGDGQQGTEEACDLGEANGKNGAECKGDCTLNVCGDGYLAASEGCDDGNANIDDGCDQCVLASCGDGMIGPGEECDAGADNGGPACSELCKLPAVCGDGMLGPGEECDAGGENSDAGKCTTACKLAVCGDGLVWAGVEACDDKNNAPGDGCEGCLIVKCGDGVIAGSEECDDGNAVANDTCDPSCKRVAFYIFATSKTFGSNLGGLEGADAKCMEAAMSVGLPGKFLAWLSDVEVNASDRLHHATKPYVLPGFLQKVAADWSDLVDGSLAHAIDVTEMKQTVPGMGGSCAAKESLVWTGTAPSGAKTVQHCNSWQDQMVMAAGTVGNTHEIDSDWTQHCFGQCTATYRLFCVEQP